MPPLYRNRRYALVRVREHLAQALAALPEPKGGVGHWRPLLISMIASINDEIGTEPEEPVDDFDAALPDPEDDRWLYRPRGNPDQDVLNALAKARAGRPLTPRERAKLASVMPPRTSGAELMDAIAVASAGEHPKDNPLPSERAARYEDCGEMERHVTGEC